ncbi:MAG: hypothetical protein ABIO70_10600 [Pseudomonadota bacterium]
MPSPLRSLLACTLLISSGASWAGGRAPDPRQAQARLEELAEAVREDSLDAAALSRFFTPPPGPLGESPAGRRLDRDRLAALLTVEGALGRVLARGTRVAAVVQGPDYVRVVLDTTPFLSFLFVREEGQVRIQRWEATSCGDCREPSRFVLDAIARAREGGRPPLVPGLDLILPELTEGEGEGSYPWRLAMTRRDLGAGYLRWLLADADVLGQEMDGVRVSVRDRVETWPVVYRDGRWGLDYERLGPDSLLRLPASALPDWHDEARSQAHALAWWIPEQRPLPGGGTVVAEGAVGVAWQVIEQRWLVVVERPDGLVAGAFGVDSDGNVSARVPLPAWPSQVQRPVRRWARAWVAALSPAGDRLLLAAAGRWWIVSLVDGSATMGPRGVIGEIVTAAWSLDGAAVIAGDELGNLALLDPVSATVREVRYQGVGENGHRVGIAGLALAPGDGNLLVARADGRLVSWSLPDLQPRGEPVEVCCGEASALAIQAGRGRALVACGEACPPVVLAAVPLYGGQPPEQYGDASLAPRGGPLSISPDGVWVVLAVADAERNAALCRADNLEAVATFSDQPLRDVAWDAAGGTFLALREDGSAVRWSVEEILASAASGR